MGAGSPPVNAGTPTAASPGMAMNQQYQGQQQHAGQGQQSNALQYFLSDNEKHRLAAISQVSPPILAPAAESLVAIKRREGKKQADVQWFHASHSAYLYSAMLARMSSRRRNSLA